MTDSADHLPHYYALLERVQRHLRPRTYAEIGVADGLSLRFVDAGTVAVGIDPEAPDEPPPDAAGEVALFRMTSDDYFATRDLRSDLGERDLDLGFVDGLHLFEFALRDFANLERAAHAGAVLLIHDCLPLDETCAERERTTVSWTGDVWKLIACLRAERPDLTVATLDVPPTGMAVVTGLDPGSTVLLDHHDELVERYRPLPYTALESDPVAVLNLVPGTWAEMARRLPDPFS